MERCKAIAASTKEQCSKSAIPGSNYCWHHYPKQASLTFVIIGALLGLVAQVVWDATTVSDEEESITRLTQELRPFLELAEQTYPDLGHDSALSSLRLEFATFRDQVLREQSTIREMEAHLSVVFSGGWERSPANHIPISMGTPTPHFLALIDNASIEQRVEFVATQLYSLKEIDSKHIRFESRQAVLRGEYPLGSSLEEMKRFDRIQVLMPLGREATNFVGGVVMIDSVEIEFYINRKPAYLFVHVPAQPFQVLVKNRYAVFDCLPGSDLYSRIIGSPLLK